MYHHVNPDGNFINVTPEIFEKHISYLRNSGFTGLHTEDFLSILSGKQHPPERPIVITFDDGWLDNWLYAFPVLKKYHMKAVIFAVTSLVADKARRGRDDEKSVLPLPIHRECQEMVDTGRAQEVMLSWDEMREMEASGLIDIQSHTHTHQRWDKMKYDGKTRSTVISRELETSKKITDLISKGDFSTKPGWIRMSIHPTHTDKEIQFLVDGLKELALNHEIWIEDYDIDYVNSTMTHKNDNSDAHIKLKIDECFIDPLC